MRLDEKRESRINHLTSIAMRGGYTKKGKFLFNEMVNDGIKMGVTKQTAQGYADAVVIRLKRAGSLKK